MDKIEELKQKIVKEHYDRDSYTMILMVGSMTAICVPVTEAVWEDHAEINGKRYSRVARSIVPTHNPLIDFVNLRENKDGEIYVDDDSPVTSGLDEEKAQTLKNEIENALSILNLYRDYIPDLVHREVLL